MAATRRARVPMAEQIRLINEYCTLYRRHYVRISSIFSASGV